MSSSTASRRVLVRCRDIGSYLDLASAASAHPNAPQTIPILGKAAFDDELARWLGATLVEDMPTDFTVPEGRKAPRPSTTDYIIAQNDSYLPVAKALARLTGRELIVTSSPSFDVIDEHRTGTIVLMGEPRWFRQNVLADLSRRALDPQTPHLGVVTARSIEMLSRVVPKVVWSPPLPLRRGLTLDALATTTTRSPRHVHHPIAAADHAFYAALRADPLEYMVIATHGAEIDADLLVGNLCGRSSATGGATGWPCRGGVDCKRSKGGKVMLVPVDRLPVRHMVLESCTGVAIADTTFEGDALMSLSALEGYVSAFLSTYKLVESHPAMGVLAGALLESGQPLGEISSLLNQVRCQVTGDLSSYVLVGDPCARSYAAADHMPATATLATPQDLVDVPCPPDATRMVDAQLTLPTSMAVDVDAVTLEVTVEPAVSDQEQMHAVWLCRPGERETRLLLVSSHARTFNRVTVRFFERQREALAELGDSARASTDFLAAVADGIRAAASRADASRLAEAGVAIEEVIGDARLVTAMARAAEGSAREHSVELGVPRVTVASLLDVFADLSARLAAAFAGSALTSHWSWAYTNHLNSGDERYAGPCFYCDATLIQTYFSTRIGTLGPRRVTMCPLCGVVADGPDGADPIVIDGPAIPSLSAPTRYRVTIANRRTYPIRFHVAATIPQAPPDLDVSISSAVVDLEPGEEKTASIDITLGTDARHGVYGLVVLAVGHLAVHLAGRPLFVRRDLVSSLSKVNHRATSHA